MSRLNDLKDRIRRLLDSSKSKELKDEIAKQAVHLIKTRTRGRKLDNTGKPFKSLAETTIQKRRYYQRYLHQSTRPATNHLTMTGQLIDAIRSKTEGTKIIVSVPPSPRRPIKPSHKKPDATNEDVAGYVQKKRPFMGLTKEDTRKLTDVYDRRLRVLVRQHLGGN